MIGERFDSVVRLCPAAMNRESGIAGVEPQGKVMGASVEPGAQRDIFHPMVELFDRVAAYVKQEEAKIYQVGIGLMLNLLDDLRNMRASELGEDALWCH